MNAVDDPMGWERFADQPVDETDVALLNQVATMYDALDPMPAGLVDRLRFAITLDALNAEVAQLQELSLADSGARAEPTSEIKTLTFTSDSLTALVNISPAASDQVRIDGWIAPGAVFTVEWRQDDQTRSATSDADGRFVFEAVPHGMTRFVIKPATGTAVVTPAVEL